MKPVRMQLLSRPYHQLSQRLLEALLSLYATGSMQDQEEALLKTEAALSVYEQYIAKEEAMLFGILHEYEPCVSAVLLSNHKTVGKQITYLRTMITAIEIQITESSEQDNSLLTEAFNTFLNICLSQMKEHQSIVHPVLWRYYSDEELKQMLPAFVISQSPVVSSEPMAIG